MTSNQHEFQTIAKGMAIILVVFGHSWRSINNKLGLLDAPIWHWLDFTIYTTHMPLFFILAGYNAWGSLQRHSLATNFKQKISRIALPYLFWSALFVLSQFLLGPQPTQVGQSLISILYSPVGIYWFLFALFFMHLSLFVASSKVLPLLVCSFLGAAFSTFYSHPWAGLFLHAPFFYLGFALASKKRTIIPPELKSRLTAAASLLFLIITSLWLFQKPWPPVSLITIPCTIAGIVFLLASSQFKLPYWLTKLLLKIGDNSFPIYLMHIFLTTGVVTLAAKLHLAHSLTILLTSLACGIVIPIIIAAIYYQLIPFFNGPSRRQ